jgi:hypothetical protein
VYFILWDSAQAIWGANPVGILRKVVLLVFYRMLFEYKVPILN